MFASSQHVLVALASISKVPAHQDMDGGKARHEPFNCEPKKQGRYVKFCLALEGKASASEALNDAGQLLISRQPGFTSEI